MPFWCSVRNIPPLTGRLRTGRVPFVIRVWEMWLLREDESNWEQEQLRKDNVGTGPGFVRWSKQLFVDAACCLRVVLSWRPDGERGIVFCAICVEWKGVG